MADTYKILGQSLSDGAAPTEILDGIVISSIPEDTVVYEVPEATQSSVSSIVITNTSSNEKSYSLSFVKESDKSQSVEEIDTTVSILDSTTFFNPVGTSSLVATKDFETFNPPLDQIDKSIVTSVNQKLAVGMVNGVSSIITGKDLYSSTMFFYNELESGTQQVTPTAANGDSLSNYRVMGNAGQNLIIWANNSLYYALPTDSTVFYKATLDSGFVGYGLLMEYSPIIGANIMFNLDNGTKYIKSSDSGLSWTTITTTQELNYPSARKTVASGNDALVVDSNGFKITTNGTTWSETSISGKLIRAVSGANGEVFAIATSSSSYSKIELYRYTSGSWNLLFEINADSITIAPVGINLESIFFNNEYLFFINTEADGLKGLTLKSTNLVSFSSFDNDLFGRNLDLIKDAIIFNNKIYGVASIQNNNNVDIVIYSQDGVSWDGISEFLPSVYIKYLNGTYVAISSSRELTYTLYSTDGVAWNQSNQIATYLSDLYSFFTDNEKFILRYNDGTGTARFVTSTDGINWIEQPSFTQPSQGGLITYGNGKYVCSSGSGGIFWSTDMVNWNTVQNVYAVSGGYNQQGIVFDNGVFVTATTYYGVYYSTDAVTWSRSIPPGGGYSFTLPVYADGTWYMAGVDYTNNYQDIRNTIYKSTDNLASWTVEFSTILPRVNNYLVQFSQMQYSRTIDKLVITPASIPRVYLYSTSAGLEEIVTPLDLSIGITIANDVASSVEKTEKLVSMQKSIVIPNKAIEPGEIHEIKGGITLGSGDQIRVYSDSDEIAINVYGVEIE